MDSQDTQKKQQIQNKDQAGNQLKETNKSGKGTNGSFKQNESRSQQKDQNNTSKNGSNSKTIKKNKNTKIQNQSQIEQTNDNKQVATQEDSQDSQQNIDHVSKENDVKKLSQLLDKFSTQESTQKRHKFWETQPVSQFSDKPLTQYRRISVDEGGKDQSNKQSNLNEEAKTELTNINTQQSKQWQDGPIDKSQVVENVQQETMRLPEFYYWANCDLDDPRIVEEVQTLLSNNYVEDDDAMFRFNYTNDMLQWALRPPGYRKDWHVGVRQSSNQKLVGFIAGIPSVIRIKDQTNQMVQIDFLCVHKKLRSKRLAPLLIKEITRRVHLQNIWYAAYTAGVTIPKPISVTRYWHRLLNPKKLIEVGFSKLQPRMTLERTIKLYKVPQQNQIPGVRQFKVPQDVEQVTALMNKYLESQEEVAHQFLHRPGVIETFVVEDPKTNQITDFVSYNNIPSSVLGNPKHSELKAAYMYYTAAVKHSAQELVQEALILAKQRDYDVFSMLDVLENSKFIKELKFAKGDGQLNYYLYNWRLTQELQPDEVGLILV